MAEKNKPKRFQGDRWFDQHVHQRTRQSLQEKEAAFARLHQHDTDTQLLELLRQAAAELGYTPNPGEMIGGTYLLERFRNWDSAVAAAELPPQRKMHSLRDRPIYRQEYKLQAAAFQAERRAEKADRQSRQQEKARQAEETRKQWEQEGLAWGREHRNDTDEQLLEYLRQSAETLGHSPVKSEVPGSWYLCKRFVSWPLALSLAQLPLPQGMKPPEKKDILEYRRKKQEPAETERK